MKRIIIKIGSKILTDKNNKLDLNNLRRLSFEICHLINHQFIDVIIVSSGAITCGSEVLKITPTTIPDKQAAASIGQILLLNEYHQFFLQQSLQVSQILLTKDITLDNEKLKNSINTINTLISHKIVPIINENDTVVTDEIKFGDNDILTSLIAPFLNVDLVVFLTDKDGLFDKNPNKYKDATLISTIKSISNEDIQQADDSLDSRTKGGMKSKLMAVKHCMDNKINSCITNGRHHFTLKDIIVDKKSGSWFCC